MGAISDVLRAYPALSVALVLVPLVGGIASGLGSFDYDSRFRLA